MAGACGPSRDGPNTGGPGTAGGSHIDSPGGAEGADVKKAVDVIRATKAGRRRVVTSGNIYGRPAGDDINAGTT